MTIGYFSLVLHSHLPYVLNHGIWPHGQDWLNEATAETYLPLLRVLRKLENQGHKQLLTINISPVLAEQLNSESFKHGFEQYLANLLTAAENDEKEFLAKGYQHRASLARRWKDHFKGIQQLYLELKKDLIAEFKRLQDEGVIEIITCAATHGYLPLLGTDESVKAQIEIGVKTYKKYFGRNPRGIWLPECAYRPSYKWKHPVGKNPKEWLRPGIEEVLAKYGIKYFIIDSPLLKGGDVFAPYLERFPLLREVFERWKEQAVAKLQERPDLTPYLPYQVGTTTPPVACYVRDPETTILVWSGEHGYPGDGNYLEFHKRHFPGGLRYWAVTGHKISLGEKREYYPEEARKRLEENSYHFKETIRRILENEIQKNEQLKGLAVVVSPYDTELFGHWWHEGPEFLERVFQHLKEDSNVEPIVLGEHLAKMDALIPISIPEGSWGQGNHHWVWLNEWTTWTWQLIYEAEEQFIKWVKQRVNQATELEKRILQQAARELLLLESSDWQFLITTWSARDYAEQRVQLHYDNVMGLLHLARKVVETNEELSREEMEFLEKLEHNDHLFKEIDLHAWL